MSDEHNWRELVELLVDDDPLTHSQEGLDDGCFFCGADTLYAAGLVEYVEHRAGCSWVLARWALGKPFGPHVATWLAALDSAASETRGETVPTAGGSERVQPSEPAGGDA